MKKVLLVLVGLILGAGVSVAAASFTVNSNDSLLAICKQVLGVVTPSPTPPPAPSPTPSPAPSPSPAPNELRFTAYITGYASGDNDPPGDGTYLNGTEGHAGGTGTYADPITLAVGYVGNKADYPLNTIFYVPNVQRYFKAQDTCADCHTVKNGAAVHLDLYAGTFSGSGVLNCEDTFTNNFTVIQNPASNYKVTAGSLYSGSTCTKQFGNTVLTQ